MAKEGRLSKEEWAYIEAHADDMSVDEIAAKLDRSIDAVLKHLQKIGKTPNYSENFEVQAEYDLKKRPIWRDIKTQFTETELETFLYHWSRIVGQFQGDVLPTEELQILDAVKLEILMNRSLTEQQDSVMHRQRLTAMVEELQAENRARNPEDRDMGAIYDLEKQIHAMRMSAEAMARDYKNYQEKKNAILKELRGTREQRVKDVQSLKKTFESMATKILTDHAWVAEKNREMEMMRLAVQAEQERLGNLHTFEDGRVDQCYLSAETVILDGVASESDQNAV